MGEETSAMIPLTCTLGDCTLGTDAFTYPPKISSQIQINNIFKRMGIKFVLCYRPTCISLVPWCFNAINAAFHSSRELVFTRSRDPGNHEFTTCQWNALLSDVTINRHRDTEV